MPSEFPRSPKLLKGAMVVFSSQKPGPPPTVIVFQYNPEQLSRSLAHRAAPPDPSSVGGAREDSFRVLGPPVETINLYRAECRRSARAARAEPRSRR